ncbi:class I adenylate-forming enzyme family protein [Conexibacter sp. CPCC 206217]|uniref:class I adenylate-forming enzyme family protein n=1 Tax=Conexibacter sp. CPCC 206217 TaxID=3064574 RepID=UPI002716B02F|nr:class I adenylate-forming enzyme family protein [Conexibacter sp. CPCC 206217]MDO8211105.1 class I adenylate-forming enzyme family protein [Conexibacter sp. CPCC 206217]
MSLFETRAELPAGLTELLDALAARVPQMQIRDDAGAVTVVELAEASMRLAGGLRAWGVRRGDHVAIWMDNCREWLELWFALARLGAVVVPLNTRFSLAEAEDVLRRGRVSRLVWRPGDGLLDGAALDAFERGGLPLAGRAVVGGTPTAAHELRFDALRAETLLTDCEEDGDAVGLIQFTSGSTSFPKGAMLRNRGLVENGWGLGRAWQLGPADRVLVSNPLFHCGGSVFSFMAGAAHGACVVLMSRWRLEDGMRRIEEHGITIAPLIDAAVRDLVAAAEGGAPPLPSLRLVSTAADRALFERAHAALGAEVSNVYGLTECSPNVCVGDLRSSLEERLAHIGRPQEGIEVSIRSLATGEEVEDGEVGEIHVRGGASVMIGYLDDPAATAAVFGDDGFLRTGDLGCLRPGGFLDYRGRAKLMIKSGGENIAIEEVEEALRSHPGLADAVVVPVPHERWAEVGFAFLRPIPGTVVEPADVLSGCRARLANFKVPKHAVIVDDLPRTGSGKVDRALLTERAVSASTAGA